jgi:hypothetical protein
VRRNPDDAKVSASGEYKRRGKPTEWTKWDLETQHQYMAWQNATKKNFS